MVSLTPQGGMKSALLFLVKLTAVLGEIFQSPNNTAVVSGETMTMNCPVTNGTSVRKWSFQSKGRVVPTIYLPSGGFHEDFRHFGVKINAIGPVTIYANSTRSSDAGIYKCHCENDVTDVVYSAHLIVLETLPVCDSNLMRSCSHCLVDGDHIWIQCSINFRGFWAPSMEWTKHGERLGPEGKTVTDGIETVISLNQSITSTLTIAVKSFANGFYYSCKLYFVKYNGTEVTTAKNFPNFTYTWNSSVIYVFSTQSVAAVISSTTETSSSVDWNIAYLCIVAALCLIFVLILTLAIRLKKKASERAACIRLSNIPDVASRQQEIPSDPVGLYTEVSGPRFRSDNVKSEKRIPGSESHDFKNSRPMNYFGDDGTEYMEVNAMGRQPMPVKLPAASNNIMFNVVGEYASIDHTLSPPIPPRGMQ